MGELVSYRGKPKPFWVKYIHQRIRQNKNCLIIISGPTGSGKSWAGVSIGQLVDPNFNINNVIFRGKQLLALINSGNLKSGSAIVWDEAGIDLSNRSWQSTTNKLLNFLLQTFRHQNFVLIFTTPYSDFVDKLTRRMFHAEFKTESIDFKNKTCKIRPLAIQYNARMQKFYYKRLRVITKESGVVPLDSWDVPAPSKELVRKYELKKTSFTASLNKEIERELDLLDKKGEDRRNKVKKRKELSEQQLKVMKTLAFNTTKETAKILGLDQSTVRRYSKFAIAKGYTLEEFQ